MPETRQGSVGELAALQRFPSERRTIEELILQDEDFRDMCEELADAELALKAAERLPPGVRAERTSEWAATVERQVAEIGRAIGNANARRRTIKPEGD